jgi:hypothetical protein
METMLEETRVNYGLYLSPLYRYLNEIKLSVDLGHEKDKLPALIKMPLVSKHNLAGRSVVASIVISASQVKAK